MTGIEDYYDLDIDGDGLSNAQEQKKNGSDPKDKNSINGNHLGTYQAEDAFYHKAEIRGE